MKVAVIGPRGQLGSDVVRVFSAVGHEVIGLTHSDVDVTQPESVRGALAPIRPEAVINTAAFHRVDECEDQAERAFQVNAIGALNVARFCAGADALCVYVSTDYVFDGDKGDPYTEDDTPRPINVYGTSKLAGEHLVRQAAPRWIVARVASLFGLAGASGKGGNFIETILRKGGSGEPLRVISDICMSPTYTADAARALELIVRARETGVFHLTNHGECSWHEFATRVLNLAAVSAEVTPVMSRDYLTRAHRPANSALGSVRLPHAARASLRPWRQALAAYMREKGHLAPAASGTHVNNECG